MHKLILVGAILLWLTAMTALFVRDVLPAWTAQDAPVLSITEFEQTERRHQQFAIFQKDGQRIGTAWSNLSPGPGNSTINGTVVLENLGAIPAIRIETLTEFDKDGDISAFRLDVFGVPMKIRVEGERLGLYFPCKLQVGPLFREANLDAAASRMIGESLRPFAFLPNLKVGQSWRMQILDPMTAVMARRAEFTSLVATVTGEEEITHLGEPVLCKVVDTSPTHVRAWVTPRGEVVRQEVDVPGLGKIVVEEEEFSEGSRDAARSRIRGFPGFHSLSDSNIN